MNKMKTIPKTIHYCWFGDNTLPENAKKCIESWKKFFPDYTIKQWNENNLKIDINKYARQAYDCKQYAFFTDVARLFIIYTYGGIYFDIDVEVIKKYDDIIKHGAFLGIESNGLVATGLGFGAEKNNWLIKAMLDDYSNRDFIKNGKQDLTPCPHINSQIIRKYGFKIDGKKETKRGITIYPQEYFNPKGNYRGDINITANTHSIHHYNGAWLSKQEKRRSILYKKITSKLGKKYGTIVYKTLFSPYIIASHIIQKISRK